MASACSSFDSSSTYSLHDSCSSTPVAWARPVISISDVSPKAVPLPPSPLASPRLQPTALPPLQHKPSRTVLSRGPFSSSSNHSLKSSSGSRLRPTSATRSTSDSDGSTNSSLGTLSSIFPQPPPRSSLFSYFPLSFTSSYAYAHDTPKTEPETDHILRARRAHQARRREQRAREQLYKDSITPNKLKKKGGSAGRAEPRGLKRSLSRGFDRLRRGKKAAVMSISSPFARDDFQRENLVEAFYRNGGRLEEEELTPTLSAPSNTPATIHIRGASPSPVPSSPIPLRRKRAKDYTPIPRRVRFAPKLSSVSAKKVTNRGRPLPKRHSPGSGPLATPRPCHSLLRSFSTLAAELTSAGDDKEEWVDDFEGESAIGTPLPLGRLVWNSDEEDWWPPSPTVGVHRRASSVVGGVDETASSYTPGHFFLSSKFADNNAPVRLPLAFSAQSNSLDYPFADLDPLYTGTVWPTGEDGLPIIWGTEEQPNVVGKAQVIKVGTPALAHRASLPYIKSPAPFTQLSESTPSRNRPLPPTPGPPVRHEWSRVNSYRTTSYGSSYASSISVSQSSGAHFCQEQEQIAVDERSFDDEECQVGSPTIQPLTLHSFSPTRRISPLRRRSQQELSAPVSPPPSGPLPPAPNFAPCPSAPRLQAEVGTKINSPIDLGRSHDALDSPATFAQANSSSTPLSPLANRRSRPTPPRLFIAPRSPPRTVIGNESPVDPSPVFFSPVRPSRPFSTVTMLGVASSASPNQPSTHISLTMAAPSSHPTTPQFRIRRASSSLSLLNRSNSVNPSLVARHTKSIASFQPSFSTTALIESTSASFAREWDDAASSTTMKGTPSTAKASVVAESAFVESPKVAKETDVTKRKSRYGSWQPLKWGSGRV